MDIRNAERKWRTADILHRSEEEAPSPGEQPVQEDLPMIDHAPVAPLTEPDDTEGG